MKPTNAGNKGYNKSWMIFKNKISVRVNIDVINEDIDVAA